MNKEDAEMIVAQLQQAHRISVGFYRRILPSLDAVANHLGFDFWFWGPIHTDLPCRRTTQPSEKWAWDFVPLFASEHVYRRVSNKKKTGPNDIGIQFWLYVEDSFMSKNGGAMGQPDPIVMPAGKAVLQAFIYRPKGEYRKPFGDLWDVGEEVDLEIGGKNWQGVNEYFEGVAFQWPLAELISNNQPIVETIKKYVGVA